MGDVGLDVEINVEKLHDSLEVLGCQIFLIGQRIVHQLNYLLFDRLLQPKVDAAVFDDHPGNNDENIGYSSR